MLRINVNKKLSIYIGSILIINLKRLRGSNFILLSCPRNPRRPQRRRRRERRQRRRSKAIFYE
jgi:hypothetical protein